MNGTHVDLELFNGFKRQYMRDSWKMIYSPGTTSPGIFMQQILDQPSYYNIIMKLKIPDVEVSISAWISHGMPPNPYSTGNLSRKSLKKWVHREVVEIKPFSVFKMG